ncbi:hypothetical protein [Nonomuraea polychroma]|nr:hypothetical protein [Nonomuraea polychroma]
MIDYIASPNCRQGHKAGDVQSDEDLRRFVYEVLERDGEWLERLESL